MTLLSMGGFGTKTRIVNILVVVAVGMRDGRTANDYKHHVRARTHASPHIMQDQYSSISEVPPPPGQSMLELDGKDRRCYTEG